MAYMVTTRNRDCIIAVVDRRKAATRLVADLEAEDKYLGLYKPKRYAIVMCKGTDEIVRMQS